MPVKETLLSWFSANGVFLGGAAMAAAYSAMQSKKNTGHIDWLEAGMCALIAFGVSSALEFMHFPAQLTWLASVFVGSVGSQYLRSRTMRQVDAKIADIQQKVDSITTSSAEEPKP